MQAWSELHQNALDTLLPLVYDELRGRASRYSRKERPDHTLQTTALIYQACLKLIGQGEIEWQSCNHFFALASTFDLISKV